MSEIVGTNIYLDSNTFIYQLDDAPPYADQLQPLFQAIDAGSIEAISSEIALAECMVKPFKDGSADQLQAYRNTLRDKPHLRFVPATRSLWLETARIRSRSRLKLPDAVHLATAESMGCTTLVTNDDDFNRVASMKVVVLAEIRTR